MDEALDVKRKTRDAAAGATVLADAGIHPDMAMIAMVGLHRANRDYDLGMPTFMEGHMQKYYTRKNPTGVNAGKYRRGENGLMRERASRTASNVIKLKGMA